jgi:hypothetical protein
MLARVMLVPAPTALQALQVPLAAEALQIIQHHSAKTAAAYAWAHAPADECAACGTG